MVVQQAVCQNTHWQPLVGQLDELDKGGKVAVFVKYIAPRIATVQDVVTNSACRSSRGSWHASNLAKVRPARKINQNVPFLPPTPSIL
jgi:hypothetical protein